MVYETLKGNSMTYYESKEQLNEVKGNIRFLALSDLIITWATTNSGSQRGGIIGIIIVLFLKVLEEVWDLLSNFLIPAVSIEKKGVTEVVDNLKYLKNNIPATLTGVFAIDFVGSVLGTVFTLSFIIFLILGIVFGWIIALITDFMTITLAGFTFSYVLLPIFLLINSLIKSIYNPLIQAIKQIYFSIFYVTLAKPSEIKPELQGNLTNYLKMEELNDQIDMATQNTS